MTVTYPPDRGAAVYYAGSREPGGVIVTANNDAAGWTAPLVHFVRHSPRGFGWGKAGPEAADLALALIIDAIGPAALCPGCNGTHKIVLDPAWNGDPAREPSVPYDPMRPVDPLSITTCLCEDGIRPGLPYHDLVYTHVARWKADTWTLARADLLDELTTFYPPGAVPEWLHDVVTGRVP